MDRPSLSAGPLSLARKPAVWLLLHGAAAVNGATASDETLEAIATLAVLTHCWSTPAFGGGRVATHAGPHSGNV